MDELTRHFTLKEMTRSSVAVRQGIPNDPDADVIQNLRLLCVHILEPLRQRLGMPVFINSGYRSEALNLLVGGSGGSQHLTGEAADIEVDRLTPSAVCQIIVDAGLPFDQLIEEFGEWTHVSYSRKHRRERLRAVKKDGVTWYEKVEDFR